MVPATTAFWLTVLYTGTAAITAGMLHIALQGTLYGIDRTQSLAVLASYAGTLRHWPDDLEPIAGRLAEALDIDRYAILARRRGPFTEVLAWPRAGDVGHQFLRNAIAPPSARARSRTTCPSLPLLTIHWPFSARPVIIPTWWGHTTTAPMLANVADPQCVQLRARL